LTTLLIDADLLAYKAASATEFSMSVEVEGSEEEDLYVRIGSLVAALDSSIAEINRIKAKLYADDVMLCFSSNTNFRKALYPEYKANRIGPKPVVYGVLKKKLGEAFKTFERPGLEADDVMGILGTHKNIIKGDKIIVSEDKDMLQINCPVYRGGKVQQPGDTYRWHMLQTLTGDPTDNYPGCKGVGIKTAEKILEEGKPKTWWAAVLAAYADAGFDEAFALNQARVARILNASLYDFNKKEPILWLPE
jgi:DNA polymerase-1